MNRPLTALLSAAIVVIGACSADTPEPGGSPTPSPSASATASEPATDGEPASTPTTDATAQPFPANTADDEGDPAGQQVVVTSIEIAARDGYDRVTLGIGGEGQPGWLAEYVDRASAQGSGEDVEVDGDAIIALTLNNMAIPPESDVPAYDGPDRIAHGGASIVEVRYGTTYEGYTQLWVGTTGRLPYRVFLETNPTRVIVDVVHPDRAS